MLHFRGLACEREKEVSLLRNSKKFIGMLDSSGRQVRDPFGRASQNLSADAEGAGPPLPSPLKTEGRHRSHSPQSRNKTQRNHNERSERSLARNPPGGVYIPCPYCGKDPGTINNFQNKRNDYHSVNSKYTSKSCRFTCDTRCISVL
jgi:hypothetical protein